MNLKMVLATVVICALSIFAKPEFKASGNLEFRFRGEFYQTLDGTGAIDSTTPKTSYSEYSNKLGWNVRLDLDINEQLAIKTRLSNPEGYNLETVYSNMTFTDFGSIVGIALPRAEIIWTPNGFSLGAGILEVKNSTALTVVRGAELSSYSKSFNVSDNWAIYTNESQVGARVGYAFDKVALNVTYSIAEYVKSSDTETHKSDQRFILDAPISLNKDKKMKLTPSFIIRTGANGTYVDRTASYHGGVDFTTKINDALSLKAGAAYGAFKETPDADDVNKGFMATVTPSLTFGVNSVKLGYSFSTGNPAGTVISNYYQTLDFSWGFNVHKNISIAPRVRAWYNTNDTNDGGAKKLRPELIIKAKF